MPVIEQQVNLEPFEVSLSLASVQVNAKTYLSSRSSRGKVVSSCLIFQDNKVLLIERRTRFSSPTTWEIPGGICDATDETLLHSAARETLEETGLSVKRFNHQVGNGYHIEVKKHSPIGARTWIKVVFDADVEEASSGDGKFDLQIPETRIQLSHEHRNWMWATEEQVRTEKANNRSLALRIVERQILLDGFALRRGGIEGEMDTDVVMQDAE